MAKDYKALQNRICYPPDPNPKKPRIAPPPLACDTHVHLFGPPHLYPFQSKRVYTPPAAPLQHYLAIIAVTGIERTVLVTPNAHGTDNSVVHDALIEVGDRFRGIAKIDDETSDAELERLHAAGFRGARFNLIDELGGGVDLDMFERAIARIAPLGWCVEFHVMPDGLVEYAEWFRKISIPVIIDHLGRCDFVHGVNYPPFQTLVDLMRDQRFWCKLCSINRLSQTGAPWDDALPFAEALITVAPDRLLWGTDWPHGNTFTPGQIPNDGDLVDLLAHLAPDEALRQKIFVDNPARLFGWDEQG
ncbi:MAG: amidohydrolase family protein [Rhodospirillaceae bacterium]|nr:amidohydrolase family protein [Rhodospirillaceae bacterium]MBT5457343.1 amidohydrolase family protein [Rhodospirillaceae bacterium]